MTRSRRSARDAGTKFETLIATHLRDKLSKYIERRTRSGGKDRGDIANVYLPNGERVVIECKDYGGEFKITPWLREASIERENDRAAIGVVIAKRRGITAAEDQVAFMTVADLVQLLTPPQVGAGSE